MPEQPTILPVRESPFAHVVADDWLDADLYGALARTFPDCPPGSGPTGFTLFWGDPAYDALIADDPAWAALFRRFHSQAFVDDCVSQFADTFDRDGRVDLSRARYVPYRESRADKERAALARAEHEPDELWVRVDIMQGRAGYSRSPHLDHRRRAMSLLIYFCDADENGMEGGDLILHGASGEEITIRPRHNGRVAFPCHNESLHSVSPIVAQTRPRNFVQVTVSSSVDLWEPVAAAKGTRGALFGSNRKLNILNP